MSAAKIEVPAINPAIGTRSAALKKETPLEASAAMPIDAHPSRAEALPIFWFKGANANAFAFGLQMPTQPNETKNIAIVVYRSNHPWKAPNRNKKLVAT